VQGALGENKGLHPRSSGFQRNIMGPRLQSIFSGAPFELFLTGRQEFAAP